MRNPCRSLALILAAGLLVAVSGRPLRAQDAKPAKPAPPAPAKHVLLSPGDLKWGPQPPGLPAGAQVAVLDGDPSKAGIPFALRAKFPDGYRVPPHWHPTAENVTVISGTLMFGMGDTFNEKGMTTLAAGGFAKMPPRMRHYVLAKGATEIQLQGVGPFAISYVNPKDDPRTKTMTQSR